MERPLPRLDLIQRFLGRGGASVEAGWSLLEAGARSAAVTRYESEPAWSRFAARREHRRCVELALERTAPGPETVSLEVIPLWTGDNEDAEPGPHWYATHAVLIDGQLAAPWEISPVYDDAEVRFERRLAITAKRWRVAHVVDVGSYARSIELPYRGKRYGVLDGELLVVTAVAARPGAPRARPTRDVPMFCQWFEFRVADVEAEGPAKNRPGPRGGEAAPQPAKSDFEFATSRAERCAKSKAELQEQLRARWITTDEEGELIPAP